jgi:hypothetical protein
MPALMRGMALATLGMAMLSPAGGAGLRTTESLAAAVDLDLLLAVADAALDKAEAGGGRASLEKGQEKGHAAAAAADPAGSEADAEEDAMEAKLEKVNELRATYSDAKRKLDEATEAHHAQSSVGAKNSAAKPESTGTRTSIEATLEKNQKAVDALDAAKSAHKELVAAKLDANMLIGNTTGPTNGCKTKELIFDKKILKAKTEAAKAKMAAEKASGMASAAAGELKALMASAEKAAASVKDQTSNLGKDGRLKRAKDATLAAKAANEEARTLKEESMTKQDESDDKIEDVRRLESEKAAVLASCGKKEEFVATIESEIEKRDDDAESEAAASGDAAAKAAAAEVAASKKSGSSSLDDADKDDDVSGEGGEAASEAGAKAASETGAEASATEDLDADAGEAAPEGADAEAAAAEKDHLLAKANADLVSGEKDIQIEKLTATIKNLRASMKVDAKIAGDKVNEVHALSEQLSGGETSGAAGGEGSEGSAVEEAASASGSLVEHAIATAEAKSDLLSKATSTVSAAQKIADAVPGPDDEIVSASEAEGSATGAASEAAKAEAVSAATASAAEAAEGAAAVDSKEMVDGDGKKRMVVVESSNAALTEGIHTPEIVKDAPVVEEPTAAATTTVATQNVPTVTISRR